MKKNEMVLTIDKLFSKSKYRGELTKENENDDFTSFLFETEIAHDKSWIIARKYDRGNDYLMYSISDNDNIVKYLKKRLSEWARNYNPRCITKPFSLQKYIFF